MNNKILVILIMSLLAVCQGKTLTTSIGGKCAKVLDGYTKCHTITVKYNLEKGRISTDGHYDDGNVRFAIRLWDADSMRIDFVADDLYVNANFAGDEYKVPKELARETKYLDIVIYDDTFDPYAEEHHCFKDDDVLWTFPIKGGVQNEYRCLPADTILKVCKSIIRLDDTETVVLCYKEINKPFTYYGRKAIMPKRAWGRQVYDGGNSFVEYDGVECPTGYKPTNDGLCLQDCQVGFLDIDDKCVRKAKCKKNESLDSTSNTCEELYPLHAHITNSTIYGIEWECDAGYIRVHDQCEEKVECTSISVYDTESNRCIQLPLHSHKTSETTWECDASYTFDTGSRECYLANTCPPSHVRWDGTCNKTKPVRLPANCWGDPNGSYFCD